MKEKEIKIRAVEKLHLDGYATWYPPKIRYFQTDVFGIFDVVAAKGTEVVFIQLTTRPHLSERRKKILSFFDTNNVRIPNSFVWAIDNKTERFIIEEIK